MKKNRKYMVILGLFLLSLVVFNCEDFQEETYELSAIDEAAITAIADTLELTLALKSVSIDSSINAATVVGGGVSDTASISVSTTLSLADVYNAMVDVGIAGFGANDTAYATAIRSDSLSYGLINISASGTYVLYVDHFIAPNIYDNTGALVSIESDDMSPQLIAGLYDVPGPVPVIKGRYEYKLDSGIYLFEVARLESTVDDNFRIVFMSE